MTDENKKQYPFFAENIMKQVKFIETEPPTIQANLHKLGTYQHLNPITLLLSIQNHINQQLEKIEKIRNKISKHTTSRIIEEGKLNRITAKLQQYTNRLRHKQARLTQLHETPSINTTDPIFATEIHLLNDLIKHLKSKIKKHEKNISTLHKNINYYTKKISQLDSKIAKLLSEIERLKVEKNNIINQNGLNQDISNTLPGLNPS